MKRAFVLMSGGIDSTTCLHKAVVDYRPSSLSLNDVYKLLHGDFSADFEVDWVEAFSIDYGQRHLKEGEYAKRTCDSFGIQHSWLKAAPNFAGPAMLTDKQIEIPNISYQDIKGVSPTYVPFRNGNLLSLVTARAQQWVNRQIHLRMGDLVDRETATAMCRDIAGVYFGAHAEDAANWAYPDCTPEFIGAIANAIYVGTYSCVRLHTPLEWLNKVEIIELGEVLGVEWENTWSCYKGDALHCGTCPTCRARKAGFLGAGVEDPTEYADVYPVLTP